MNNVEITAPAGSFEALSAAVRAGADSVYFGVGTLNMRAGAAANFAENDIPKVVELCHRTGKKAYLALNTLVYDSELEAIRELCSKAKDANIDALIASDPAVMRIAADFGLSIHISVQTNVSNFESVKFFAQFADVMVLARELTLYQIKQIIEKIKSEKICGPSGQAVKVEIFAHGAICVAVSGKCGMSLALYDKSANRGECYQPCRRSYSVRDKETGDELDIENEYIMSPKDICTLEFLDSILESGVSILKIEGRGRSADYVSTVVGVYREAVDAWLSDEYSKEKFPEWLERLKKVFNRGFWKGGYYLGEKLGEWCDVYGNAAKIKKEMIGKVTNYFSRLRVAEIQLKSGSLKIGDTILVTGPTTGAVEFEINEIRLENRKSAQFADKNSIISTETPVKVRRNDKIFLLTEKKFGEKT